MAPRVAPSSTIRTSLDFTENPRSGELRAWRVESSYRTMLYVQNANRISNSPSPMTGACKQAGAMLMRLSSAASRISAGFGICTDGGRWTMICSSNSTRCLPQPYDGSTPATECCLTSPPAIGVAMIRLIALTIVIAAATGSTFAAEPASEVIVYTGLRPSNWDLYLFDENRGSPQRLTTDPALDYNATISPDGRWAVFCSERRGSPDLFALGLKGNGPPRLLLDSDAMEDAPAFSPDGRRLAFVGTRDGNAEIYVIPFLPDELLDHSQATNLTNDGVGDFNPAFSPDGKWIAFSSDRDGYKVSEIYVMRDDGSEVKRLTNSPGWDGSPVWAPDGKSIYFYSDRDGDPRIYRADPDGSDQKPLTPEGWPALSPATSTSGRIAYTARHDGRWRFESIAADGSDRRVESDNERDYWAPVYEPGSGRFIGHGAGPTAENLFQSRTPGPFLIDDNNQRVRLLDREIRLVAVRGYFPALDARTGLVATDEGFDRIVISALNGSRRREVFKPNDGKTWRPTWSEDGRWLACTAGPTFAAPEARADIWKFHTDGSAVVNLTADSDGNDAFPDFSPDGNRIVFRSGRDGNHEIYVMDADGTNLQRITENDATDTMPAFSPHGDRIAFVSNRDGDYEIYLLEVHQDGTPGTARRMTHSAGRDTHPKFSPDGKWLVFTSERGGMNDESPLIPVFNPQPYGEIYALRMEDSRTIRLTHNKWEDGTPAWGMHPSESDSADRHRPRSAPDAR